MGVTYTWLLGIVNIFGESTLFHADTLCCSLSPLSNFDYSLNLPIHYLFFFTRVRLKKKKKCIIDSTVLETIYAGFLKWRCQRRNRQDIPLAAWYQWLQKTIVTGVIPSTDLEKEGRQVKKVLILCSSLGLQGTGTTYNLSAFIPWLCKIRTRALHSDWGLKRSLMLLYNRSNFNTVRSDREAQNFCNGSWLAKITIQ